MTAGDVLSLAAPAALCLTSIRQYPRHHGAVKYRGTSVVQRLAVWIACHSTNASPIAISGGSYERRHSFQDRGPVPCSAQLGPELGLALLSSAALGRSPRTGTGRARTSHPSLTRAVGAPGSLATRWSCGSRARRGVRPRTASRG